MKINEWNAELRKLLQAVSLYEVIKELKIMKIEQVNIPQIDDMIYVVNGLKVMLDSDLAKLYGIPTKRLKEQVKRNNERFPSDFMFEITNGELNLLKKDTAAHGGSRYTSLVFTENGVAMLSSILNSPTAIQINIAIMRTFTKLRSFYSLGSTDNQRVEDIEKNTTKLFKIVFERLDYLEMEIPTHLPSRKKIGIKE